MRHGSILVSGLFCHKTHKSSCGSCSLLNLSIVKESLTRSGHIELTSAVHTKRANNHVCWVLHLYAPRKEIKLQTQRHLPFWWAPCSQPENRHQSHQCTYVHGSAGCYVTYSDTLVTITVIVTYSGSR